jgi:hypothetical protein
MITRILASAVVAAAFCGPVLAAPPSGSTMGSSPGTNGTSMTGQANNPTVPNIGAKLRKSLASAGFTDVRVMPESFLVHAKDSDGNPVMMVVNPDSVAAVTAVGGSSTSKTASSDDGSGVNGSGVNGSGVNGSGVNGSGVNGSSTSASGHGMTSGQSGTNDTASRDPNSNGVGRQH